MSVLQEILVDEVDHINDLATALGVSAFEILN